MLRFDRLFPRIAHLGFKYWRAYLLVFAVLAAASPFVLKDLQIGTASASFVAETDPVSRLYRETLERFGESNQLLIQLVYGSTDSSAVDRFTDHLAERIRALPYIHSVEANPPALLNQPRSIAMTRAALLNSDPSVAADFAAALDQKGLKRRLLKTRKRIVLSGDARDRDLIASDILNIREFLVPFYEPRAGKIDFSYAKGYFDSPAGDSRLVFVQPKGSAEDTAYCLRLLNNVEASIAAARAAVPEAENIVCRITGKYAMIGESALVLERDMRKITAIAFVLVVLLICFVFKGWRAAVVCLLPIGLSLLPVLLLARIFFNPLNFLAIGFIAIIVGLGVDVMLHCTTRLFQFSSDDLENAIVRALSECGPPIAIGILTTAGAFLSLSFADYDALVQFGLLTSSSLILSATVSICVFPAIARAILLPWKESRRVAGFASWPVRLLWRTWNHPRVSVGFTVLLVLGGLLGARSFTFDTGFRRLLPRNLPAMAVAEDLSRDYGVSFLLNTQLLLSADNYTEGLAAQSRVDDALGNLVEEGVLSAFHSPTLFFAPSPRDPIRKAAMESARERLAQNRGFFLDTVSGLGFSDPDSYRDYYSHLEEAVARTAYSSRELPRLLSDPQLARFLAVDNGRYHFRTYAWPAGDALDSTASTSVKSAVRALELPPGVTLQTTGTHELYEHLNELVGSNFARISLFGGVVIVLLTVLFFRNLMIALLSLLPLLAAVVVTFGVIVLCDLPFSPLAIGVTSMIMGIGIDYAVHILARSHMVPNRDVRDVVYEIAPILTLSALSTVIGFGALVYANHDILSFIGKAVSLGVVACLFFSIVSLPAFDLLRRKPFTRWFPPGAVLLLLVTLCVPCASAGDEVENVDALLAKIEANYGSAAAMSCKFRQQKRIGLLNKPIDLQGTILFKKPHSLRIEWRGDENMDLLCNGKTAWIIDHDLEETEQFPFESTDRAGRLAQLVPPIFFIEMSELRRSFEITSLRGQEKLTRLRFAPLPNTDFSFTEFLADVDKRGRVMRVETTLSNGDSSTVDFSDWSRRRHIPEDRFSPRTPEGKD